jgi:DNA-directed RNA polymerase specialized sigma24 family protein
MDESFTDDTKYANLISVYLRLESSTVLWLGQKILEGVSEEDLLQTTMVVILEKEIWKKFSSAEALYRYVRKALINGMLNVWRRSKKGQSLDSADKATYEAILWLGLSAFERMQKGPESRRIVEWMKSLFRDEQMHTFIEHLAEGATRGDLANDKELTPREIRNLLRRLRRNRKIREFREKGIIELESNYILEDLIH